MSFSAFSKKNARNAVKEVDTENPERAQGRYQSEKCSHYNMLQEKQNMFTLINGVLVTKKFEKKITTQNYFSGLTCASVAIGLFKRLIKWIDDTDQFCTVGAQRNEHQLQLPPNYSSCFLFVKLVFKAVLCIFGIHSPSTIFFFCFFYMFPCSHWWYTGICL